MLKNSLSHVLIVAAATKICYRTALIISLSINISIIITSICHLLFMLYFKVLFHSTKNLFFFCKTFI